MCTRITYKTKRIFNVNFSLRHQHTMNCSTKNYCNDILYKCETGMDTR